MTALTVSEKRLLAKCESDIEAGVGLIGTSLKTIRDNQLYKGEFSTFDAYCQTRLGLRRAAVYLRIQATETREQMSKILDTRDASLLPAISDSTARALAKVPEAERVEVFRNAVKQAGGKAPVANDVQES
jgi:hypothetical protein